MKEPRYVFEDEPPVGHIYVDQGHRYTLAEVRDHLTRDGEPTWLLRWIGTCAKCGEPFEQVTGRKLRYLNRRCATHAKPAGSKAHARVKPWRG